MALAVDKFSLPACGRSGKAGFHLKQAWFDGSLSLNAMAAWLYCRAGTGKGRAIYLKEISARFGWSRQTRSKVLNELIDAGLIQANRSRNAKGQLGSVAYTHRERRFWAVWPTVKKPGNGFPCDGFSSNTLT